MTRSTDQSYKKDPKKTRIAVLAVILIALLSVSITVWILSPESPPSTPEHTPDTITLVTIFTDDDQHAVINRELEIFKERYPLWEIEHDAVPYRELTRNLGSGEIYSNTDIVTIFNPAAFDDGAFHTSPIPWSGELWGLYYHSPTLEAALDGEPATPEDRAELEELFERTADAGLRPLALGASHGWPLTALMQHTAGLISITDPQPARDIAAGRLSTEDEPMQRVLELLRSWREHDWLSETAHTESWTAGPREILNGDAAFTLLNQQAITPVPVSRRNEIGFMPFPGDWAIGSVIYLARPSASEDRRSARELEGFLTSSGTVDRLERNLGRPFFGGVQDDALPAEIIPSVTTNPNSAYHRSLWQTARSAIWDG